MHSSTSPPPSASRDDGDIIMRIADNEEEIARLEAIVHDLKRQVADDKEKLRLRHIQKP